jgi:hypothetical protein
MATNFFSPKGFLVKSFLIDGQWLIVGFDLVDKFATITSDDGAPTVATTKDEHGHTWSLAHIPDNATTANLGIDTPPFVNFQRPVR